MSALRDQDGRVIEISIVCWRLTSSFGSSPWILLLQMVTKSECRQDIANSAFRANPTAHSFKIELVSNHFFSLASSTFIYALEVLQFEAIGAIDTIPHLPGLDIEAIGRR